MNIVDQRPWLMTDTTSGFDKDIKIIVAQSSANGPSAFTLDNPLAKVRRLSLRTGGQCSISHRQAVRKSHRLQDPS